MRRIAALLGLAVVACACAGFGSSAKSRTPVTAKVSKLEMSAKELRIRVRALIRPTLGIVEESADRILAEERDPRVRRAALVWKIETTTTLLAAMLRNDPVLALADAWGYVLQVGAMLQRPDASERLGPSVEVARHALVEIQDRFREFAASLQEGFTGEALEAKVREWAERHPIQGALCRRPSMDSAVADVLASSGERGALAAIGGLDETTADVMTRMDLYTIYLPRLARWEAELAVDDLAGGTDPKTVLSEFEQLTRSADRVAGVAESGPSLIAGERKAALDGVREERLAFTQDLRGELAAAIDAIHRERVEFQQEIEALLARLVDRSSGPLEAGVRTEVGNVLKGFEQMRVRLIEDAGPTLEKVVDRAFYRALELLLIAAVLAGIGILLHARLTRRQT